MNPREIIEPILQSKMSGDMSFHDALKATKVMLEGLALDGLDSAIAEIEREHDDRVNSSMKLFETTISHQLDNLQQRWYHGSADDGVWSELADRMRNSGLGSALDDIDKSTDAIVAACAQPFVANDRRLGLVVGNVQSGKTANYSAVIAKALDQGYKFVIVLSGIHNNLRRQTQLRLERDLGLLEDSKSWIPLTTADADFGTAVENMAGGIISRHDRVLAVVKKNKTRLENLLAFLRKLDADVKRSTPILIIDDESDQATPDASSDKENNPTTISALMGEIWDQVVNGTYIGYTATPFANVFMDPKSEAKSLYPRNFIHVMPTPGTYFGAERLFGLDSDVETSEQLEHDLLRRIPDAELVHLRPAGRNAQFEARVTPALADAIRWFVVASAVRRVRGQSSKHSTMLIHTTHNVQPHFELRDAVAAYLDPRRARGRDGDVAEFYQVFHDEIDRAPELYSGDDSLATWPRVQEEILNVLRNLRVAVDNGSADPSERLEYRDEEPQSVIVIGGGTLSRGLTLEGLFVSFFTRTSDTYDTLLQMGRWFGYRNGYEDLQRIWLSDGLEEDYRFLAQVEHDLREDIARLINSGQTPADIGVRVQQHPGRLQITNPNKMKHAAEVEVDFEGYRLQTYIFDVSSPHIVKSNLQATKRLISQIKENAATPDGAPARASRVFADVEVQIVKDFFESFSVHSHFGDSFADAVEWAQQKLPKKRWNVVVAAGSTSEEFDAGPFQTAAIRRAPIKPDEDAIKKQHVNIRALMSGDDMVLDLRLLDEQSGASRSNYSGLKREKQIQMRKNPDVGDGKGLLVIYPISRYSEPAQLGSRTSMQSALAQVNAETGTDSEPIIGVALVAPMDSRRELRVKGTYLAVTPHFESDDDFDEIATPDTEKNFNGLI